LCGRLPHFLCAGVQACTDAIPGIASVLLCRYLLAIQFDGILADFFSLPAIPL